MAPADESVIQRREALMQSCSEDRAIDGFDLRFRLLSGNRDRRHWGSKARLKQDDIAERSHELRQA